jgi:hypothetical protein
MSESAKSIGTRTIQLFSKLLMVLGGLVFLIGDRFLEGFAHFSFVTSEAIGIVSGLLLCGLAYSIGTSVSGGKGW